MRFLVRLIAPALFCAATSAAFATTITSFTITGGDGTFSFSLPSTATPTVVNSSYDQFTLTGATYNGQQVAGDTILFYTPADGGGLYLSNAAGTFFDNEFGPQVFTGTSANPIFQSGSFTFTHGNSSLNGIATSANGDVLTISVGPETSPVPEPSTLAFFGTGALGLAGVARRLWPA